MLDTLGHYRIIRKLGQGGMGVVYEARDEHLGRTVALKLLAAESETASGRERLWREARSLARVSHPNICQIFDAQQVGTTLFLVLELLEGESLAERLKAGAVPVPEALGIARQVLTALEALHRLSLVHRDLKPSNIFLTPHGVKLLDFGLARSQSTGGDPEQTATALTGPGTLVGTPHYMAPEQARGQVCGPLADIFAAGCVLYEVLAGARAFGGETCVDVLYGVLHREPPPLGGSAQIEALDHIIRRALAKEPERRWPSAGAMLAALDSVEAVDVGPVEVAPRMVQRLIALPFRMLRKDDETEFLAFSLPDAISNSLAGLDSLIVRSSLVAARFEGQPDFKRVAAEAQVDAVLTGSLLRTNGQVRVTCQLVEAPGGAVLWAQTSEVSIQDLFGVQDALAKGIVTSLLPSLSDRERRSFTCDVAQSARAYEFFLRGNQIAAARGIANMRLARDLYRQCLEDDPNYAPAWAALGRTLRFICKFGEDPEDNLERAAEAFRRAFALNPDLALAHNLYTPTECDLGRAPQAMLRLLERARLRRHDANLFAGLVQACRYCGELDASVAAHRRARALDPHVVTSVAHTYFLLCDYTRTLECYSTGTAYYLDCAALACSGREDEALARLEQRESAGGATGAVGAIMGSLRAYLRGDLAACLEAIDAGEALARRDPETLFYMARHLARIAAGTRAIAMLSAVVENGFLCESSLERDPWLASVRAAPGFEDLLARVHQRRSEVHAAFVAAGGEQILPILP